jgi:hypothetical protein
MRGHYELEVYSFFVVSMITLFALFSCNNDVEITITVDTNEVGQTLNLSSQMANPIYVYPMIIK